MTDRYDELRAALSGMKATNSMVEATHWMAVIMRESEALLSERDSLLAALKPLADEAEEFDRVGWEDDEHPETSGSPAKFTVGDLRRAADLLALSRGAEA